MLLPLSLPMQAHMLKPATGPLILAGRVNLKLVSEQDTTVCEVSPGCCWQIKHLPGLSELLCRM